MGVKEFVHAWNLERASQWEILAVLGGITVVLLILALRDHQARRLTVRAQCALARRDFQILCRERGLAREETELMRAYGRQFGDEILPGLVASNFTFDQFVRHTLKQAEASQIPRLTAVLSNTRSRLGFRPPPRGITLSSTRELAPGQILYLVFSADRFIECMVREVDEIRLRILVEGRVPRTIPLAPGAEVRLHFNRTNDARYTGTGLIRRVEAEDDGIFLTLDHADQLRREQRRQDFRVEQNRSVALWVVPDLEAEDLAPLDVLNHQAPERVTLDDLSGGGASIILRRELPVRQKVYLRLDPTGCYGLPVVGGTVVRSSRRTGLSCWAVSVRFDDLRPSERQKLVRHVFMQEREIARAG